MTTLIIGASGATGKLLVEQLINSGNNVKIIIRPSSNIPNRWNNHGSITIIRKNITELSVEETAHHLTACDSVAFCLGHNMTWKGIFGHPKTLVADTVRLFCEAILSTQPGTPMKFVLMNTVGYRNMDLHEKISFAQKIVMTIIRTLLPPHSDNEAAADFLRTKIGKKEPKIQWVVVRPDNLTNENTVSSYETCISPTNSLFNPRKVSRINVAHFMASLVAEKEVWEKWKGKMPVIYNQLTNPDVKP